MPTSTVRANAQYWALLLLLLWLPLPLGSNRPWFAGLMQAACFILFALYCWQNQANRIQETLKPYWPLLLPISLIQLWAMLQLCPLPVDVLTLVSPAAAQAYQATGASMGRLSLDPAATFAHLLQGLAYLSLLILVLLQVNSLSRLKALVLVIIGAGCFQALYGALLVLIGSKGLLFALSPADIATGSFVYKNHYANFLLLSLSVGTGYFISQLNDDRKATARKQIRQLLESLLHGKAVLRIGLVLMVIALVMSRSRMGATAFFVSISLASLLALWFIRQKRKALMVFAVSMLVLDLLVVSSWFGLQKLEQRLQATSLEQESRDEVVAQAQALIRDYPLTGTGLGSFYGVFPSVQGGDVRLYYDHAHNDYVQFAVELGLPMTLLAGWAVLWSLWQALMALKERKQALCQGLSIGCIIGINGMLIHISVDFNLQAPANTAYFLVLLAIAAITRRLERSRPAPPANGQAVTE